MQTALIKIWILFADSISFDDDHYAKYVSYELSTELSNYKQGLVAIWMNS